jgi:rhodanese-related sulfurtransferase
MAILTPLAPAEVKARLDRKTAILVDIREPGEFARRHVAGARSQPLSTFATASLPLAPDRQVIFTCKTGMRTGGACGQLAAAVANDAFVLDGGVDAWAAAGLPVVEDHGTPMEIARQVRLVAGLLVLTGVAAGLTVTPWAFGLTAFVGAGLAFAGATGFCGLARLLMLAPWNRRAV